MKNSNIEYKIVKKRKLKKKNFILLIILLITFITLPTSFFKLFVWNKDNKNIKKQLDNINDIVEIKIIESNKTEEIIEQKNINKTDLYWDYIKMNLIDVNFEELKKVNNDTKGWIQINGTNVNYPFVQTTDNKYYLNHAFDKSSNGGGWVYLDYRNNLNSDRNTILYGHGRQNKTIFGSLKNILYNDWINNPDNFIIKLSTEHENTLWQIFSIYRIPTTNDYIRTEFINDDDFNTFANMLLERSDYNFNTTISGTDKILTLSTCYNDDDKIAIHAKLIKKELKQN